MLYIQDKTILDDFKHDPLFANMVKFKVKKRHLKNFKKNINKDELWGPWISLFYLFSGLSPGFDRLFSSVVVVFGELTLQGFSGVSSVF
jgi:Ni/Fe-hydrogenase subunit HybB-like protein